MSLTTALAAVAALGAGLAGAVTAYQIAAPEPVVEPSAAVETQTGNEGRARAARPRFAPCRPPAEQEGKRCVTTVTRTVVLPGPTATSVSVSRPARSGGSSARAGGQQAAAVRDDHHDDDRDEVRDDDHHSEDDESHHSGEGEDGHHGDDDDRDDDRDEDRDDDEDDD